MPRILLSLSIFFLTLSAVFGVLKAGKSREGSALPRTVIAPEPRSLPDTAPTPDASLAAATARNAEAESKLGEAEADLIKSQTERAALQARLQANEAEIADLKKRLEDRTPADPMPDTLPMPGAGNLQTQLEDTRQQLESAERENQVLAARIESRPTRPTAPLAPSTRAIAPKPRPNVRGTVLAVNQAYNFVVLDLGGRQGLEAESEMLVLRRGVLIGKIRVSSVEPATAIGDIVTHSLARGVQVQPGDVVIYAGSNS